MRWYPLGADRTVAGIVPPIGTLVAIEHSVWRVDGYVLLRSGGIRVFATFVGGRRPPPADPGDVPARPGREAFDGDVVGSRTGWSMDFDSLWLPSFYFYPQGRWPQCSCCGEPMPCRTQMLERRVAEEVAVSNRLMSRVEGQCWGCGKPITARQKVVEFPGPNVELPGGIPARFHGRLGCSPAVAAYEQKWEKANGGVERVTGGVEEGKP